MSDRKRLGTPREICSPPCWSPDFLNVRTESGAWAVIFLQSQVELGHDHLLATHRFAFDSFSKGHRNLCRVRNKSFRLCERIPRHNRLLMEGIKTPEARHIG